MAVRPLASRKTSFTRTPAFASASVQVLESQVAPRAAEAASTTTAAAIAERIERIGKRIRPLFDLLSFESWVARGPSEAAIVVPERS